MNPAPRSAGSRPSLRHGLGTDSRRPILQHQAINPLKVSRVVRHRCVCRNHRVHLVAVVRFTDIDYQPNHRSHSFRVHKNLEAAKKLWHCNGSRELLRRSTPAR